MPDLFAGSAWALGAVGTAPPRTDVRWHASHLYICPWILIRDIDRTPNLSSFAQSASRLFSERSVLSYLDDPCPAIKRQEDPHCGCPRGLQQCWSIK